MKNHTIIPFLKKMDACKHLFAFDVDLRKKTSFGCNASAAAMFTPQCIEDLQRFLRATSQAGFVYLQDMHVLGKGSNVLFEDAGYAGCLLDLSQLRSIETIAQNAQWTLRVGAGVGMGMLLQQLRKYGYTGFEFVFGIPGSIGGGIRMNAGTTDGWFSQVLRSVEGVNAEGTPFVQNVSEADFAYRDFPFGSDKVITGGVFVFEQSTQEVVEDKIARAKVKRDRQPLSYPNFGSVFKNPTLEHAGALIEQVGLKGKQIGQVQIAPKHANFMINHSQARVDDVKALIALAQKTVQQQKNIYLETEVHILGDSGMKKPIAKDAKVAVLMGGPSKERDVSLDTGKAIAKGLRASGYSNVHEIDPQEIPDFHNQVWDAVFVALHGEWGEDGQVQRILESRGIAYTGTRAEASALAMSKFDSKQVFVSAGIPTLPFTVSTDQDDFAAWQANVSQTLTYPIIGKPDREGSSIGMQIVREPEALQEAFAKAHQFGTRVLWENYLEGGIDYTVGVLNGKALPVVEIRPKSGMYDYAAKYTKGLTDYHCPARLPEEVAAKLQSYTLQAFEALGCRSWGRVDFMCKDDQIYCLEINTIPGMTPTSLLPKAAQQKGLSFDELVEIILLDAL